MDLTIVYLDGKYHVAQYGLSENYLEDHGVKILEFLKTHDLNIFKDKVRKCCYVPENILSSDLYKSYLYELYPHLSHQTGPEILELIYKSEGIPLINDIEFAAKSSLCEFAWVIDLDESTLEVYAGYNEHVLGGDERFSFLTPACTGYYQVRQICEWDLTDLPKNGDFIENCEMVY